VVEPNRGWRLQIPLTAPLQLLLIASRSKLSSLEMGSLVALRDVPAEIVERCVRRRSSRAWCLTDRGWFLILLCHVLHSSTLR
jgi:hypothetical protein